MNNYMCIHTFTSEEARREYLTPPEKRDPPEKRLTEKEWASFGNSTKATCLQEWLGDEEFFFCHWYAESPDAILEQLDILGHTSLVITACYEMERFTSAFRNSDEPRYYPDHVY